MPPIKELDMGVFARNNAVAQARKTYESADYWSPKVAVAGQTPARNRFRLMPPHENMEEVFVETKLHYFPSREVNAKTGRAIPIVINCLSQFGEDCSGCKHVASVRAEAAAAETDADKARLERAARDMAAKVRIFVQLVDINDPQKGVQRYGFPPDVEKKIRACFFDDNANPRNITHPTTGRDIIMECVRRQGTDFIDYPTVRPAEAPTPLADMDWLEKVEDLTVLARRPTVDDMAKAVRGERSKSTMAANSATEVAKPKAATAAPAPPPAAAPPAPAPVAAAPAAPPAPAPAAEAPAPASRRRAAPATDEAPPAPALALIAKWQNEKGQTFTPQPFLDDATLATVKKPDCWLDVDLNDQTCRSCKVLLNCGSLRLQGHMPADAQTPGSPRDPQNALCAGAA